MNAISPLIRKAERRKAKLRLAMCGPTGSGKTMSALKMAFGIGGKVGMIDTENGSGDLYADLGEYDIISLTPPYTIPKYREAIMAFEAAGYDVIIIDSLTHAWAGSGGLLDKQGQAEKAGKNSYTAWRDLTPEHNKLVEQMLGSPCHIIGTMRVKTEYVMEKNERGKMEPRKVGLSPVQRDGMEYEFTVVMDVNQEHQASASKDRTSLFDGWSDRITEKTGQILKDWLESGSAPLPPPPPARTWAMAFKEIREKLAACQTETEVVELAGTDADIMKCFDKGNDAMTASVNEAITDAMARVCEPVMVDGEVA